MMNQKELQILADFILNTSIPEVPYRKKTFLEISGYPHYENVISNFYAFFLNKEEDHNFNDLFLRSLCQLIHEKAGVTLSFEDYDVVTEQATNGNGRIDILVTDEVNAIIIENKIYHWLHNDLEDYWSSVSCERKVGVILTINSAPSPNNNYMNITHVEFLKAVKRNMVDNLQEFDEKYLMIFKEFTQTLYNISNQGTEMENLLRFYINNKKKLEELVNVQNQAYQYIYDAIENVANQLNYTCSGKRKEKVRFLIPNSNSSLRYYIDFGQIEKEDFNIYLELVGDEREKMFNEIKGSGLLEKYSKKEIYFHDEKYENVIDLFYKSYWFTEEQFLNLENFFIKILKEDWEEVEKEINDVIRGIKLE